MENEERGGLVAPYKLYSSSSASPLLTSSLSSLPAKTRYPLLRCCNIFIGSVVSIVVRAANEIVDKFGFIEPAGASYKNTFADLVGIVLDVLHYCRDPYIIIISEIV
ncbi:hypothetical protein RHGRI_017176 [Rhododendron griersonianum]|uniref:Uncharacterized protein n=1 Tax=Rhododendron griersonianum TaxID=479676 RepID=A0AAV6JWU3_9ERIC|nr:hypothetical protein RHGRI_017176 [Rhododendron griersonianum]